MNGTRVRAIRRSVYNKLANGQIVLGWFRRRYQEVKKEWEFGSRQGR